MTGWNRVRSLLSLFIVILISLVSTPLASLAQDPQKDAGSIEAGKLADLIILDKNPLTDIRNTNTILYVMKNGEMFEGETLNQVWPVQKKLEKQYWWDRDPQ